MFVYLKKKRKINEIIRNQSTSFEPKGIFDRRVRNTLTNKLRVFSLEKKKFIKNPERKMRFY